MYCKVFASLYQGTLRGQSNEILVFTNLLAHADKDGFIDKHFRAIAEETGLNLEEVKQAIINLESPDPESRSPEEEGARIVRLDEHRVWGWRIVNYVKYRALRNMDDRREQNRIAQEKWRKIHVSKSNKNKPQSAEISHCHAQSAHADADADADSLLHTESTEKPKVEGCSLARAKNQHEVENFVKSIGLPSSDGEWFWDKCEGSGWRNDGRPIKNWQATIRSWKRIHCMASQKNLHASNGRQESGSSGQWAGDYLEERKGYKMPEGI